MKLIFDECYGERQHAQCPRVVHVRGIDRPVAECSCPCHDDGDRR